MRHGMCDAPHGEEGQSTLEYLLVALGILAVVVALGALVRLGARGTLSQLATRAASHSTADGIFANVLLDVLLY